jgi:hypothetical protein|tara:strand:+ start:114 stop:245 length:132 start_codon:yes stop_codon:yes gene_type:complete
MNTVYKAYIEGQVVLILSSPHLAVALVVFLFVDDRVFTFSWIL